MKLLFDAAGPRLTISAPDRGTILSQSNAVLVGETSPGVVLSVDGVRAELDSGGAWFHPVDLDIGVTTFDVRAWDSAGRVTSLTWSVTYRQQPTATPDADADSDPD